MSRLVWNICATAQFIFRILRLVGMTRKFFIGFIISRVHLIWFKCGTLSIHHECEGAIEKSIPRITNWHHEACRVMTISDHEGQIFSIPTSHS